MKKIVITGPESTGKSTLASALAKHYGTSYTEEQARSYLNTLERPYEQDDLEKIAERQIQAEEKFAHQDIAFLFCDTDLLTIKIWSDYKYGAVSNQILRWINQREYDLYLLCMPDIPWEPDPLREHPNERHLLFEKHLDELIHYQKDFEVVEGTGKQRLDIAIQHIEKYRKFWD